MTDLTGAIEGATWRKSSRSNGAGGQCVEVADNLLDQRGVVYVRDSKHPSGPALAFARDEWVAFVDGVKGDEFAL